MAMILIFFSIVFVNLVWLIIKKNNLWIGIGSALALVVMMAGNQSNMDFHNYSQWYVQHWYPASVEKGYVKCANFCSSLGISYGLFLILLFSACALLIGYTVIKLHANVHAVILMFCGYQIFFDYVQIRNTVSVALLVAAIYLITVRKRIIAGILIALSVFFHVSMIVYLPIIFVPASTKMNKLYRAFLIAILVFCALTFVNGNRLPFIEVIEELGYIDADKYEKYFTTSSNLGFVLPFALQLANLFLIMISDNAIQGMDIKRISQDNRSKEKILLKIQRFSSMTKGAVVLSSVALPMVMINEEFVRFFRNCNILLYVEVAIIITLCSNRIISRKLRAVKGYCIDYTLYTGIVFAVILLWIVLYTPQGIVASFFTGNRFLSF